MITFDTALFRLQFKEYADTVEYSDAVLNLYFTMAETYISNNNYTYLQSKLPLALNLMTAHLLRINDMTISGDNGMMITSSTVGGVTTTITPPTVTSEFKYWLNTTPYGMQLNSLLKLATVGGFMIGGCPERSNFRKFYGSF